MYPLISVIIPTFNEECRINICLASIRDQKYPLDKIEIIIIDDNSTDRTVEIATKFGATILINGTHHIERGKSIGLGKARGEFIFFMDADNVLTSNLWFKKCIDIFNKNRALVGIQPYRFLYKKSDYLPNRYCALYGVNDPFVFYLKKRGSLAAYDRDWIYPDTLLDNKKDYFLTKFNTNNLPTIGSQGYMTKKSLLLKTHWKPFFFHLDSAYELVDQGYNKFAYIKLDSEHDYSHTLYDMVKKWNRNINLYWEYKSFRKYNYQISKIKLILILVTMVTIVVPMIDSIRGFMKRKDIAWFLHPLLCVIVVIIYGKSTLKNVAKNIIR